MVINNGDGNWAEKVLKVQEAVTQALLTRGRTRPPGPPPGFEPLGQHNLVTTTMQGSCAKATPMMAVVFFECSEPDNSVSDD